MRIEFRSSGGIANLSLNYQVETDTLPKEQAQELLKLVNSSGVLNLNQTDIPSPPSGVPPDTVSYHLLLSEGGRQKTLTFNDVTAPVSLRPLLTRLQDLALEQKRRGKR